MWFTAKPSVPLSSSPDSPDLPLQSHLSVRLSLSFFLRTPFFLSRRNPAFSFSSSPPGQSFFSNFCCSVSGVKLQIYPVKEQAELNMSAIVCGKRAFFEELSSPVTKRARCTTSPARLSPSRSAPESFVSPSLSPLLLDRLISLFPDMDDKLLERALEECGDLDLAIKRLHELRLGCATNNVGAGVGRSDDAIEVTEETEVAKAVDGVSSENQATPTDVPLNGAQWVELFVKEMISASNMDDARIRAAKALEALEKSISARTSQEVAQNFHLENTMMKEQIQALLQENGILKRAVSIQHERQKDWESKVHEVEHLKQLVTQYQEQIRTLEVNNYALSMHLKQAQQSNSMPGSFHPDIF